MEEDDSSQDIFDAIETGDDEIDPSVIGRALQADDWSLLRDWFEHHNISGPLPGGILSSSGNVLRLVIRWAPAPSEMGLLSYLSLDLEYAPESCFLLCALGSDPTNVLRVIHLRAAGRPEVYQNVSSAVEGILDGLSTCFSVVSRFKHPVLVELALAAIASLDGLIAALDTVAGNKAFGEDVCRKAHRLRDSLTELINKDEWQGHEAVISLQMQAAVQVAETVAPDWPLPTDPDSWTRVDRAYRDAFDDNLEAWLFLNFHRMGQPSIAALLARFYLRVLEDDDGTFQDFVGWAWPEL